MTLDEFVKDFMEANGITSDLKQMIGKITSEARKVQKNGCACLTEEDVEKIILGAKLEPINKEQKKVTPKEEKPVKKAETKPMKEKQNGQLSLFDMLGDF